MTKKSKKKAAKFGTRKLDSGGVTSIPLNFSSNISRQKPTEDIPEKIESESFEVTTKSKRKKKGKANGEILELSSEENQERCVYPFDLWCLISKYVVPESIGVFASLCKDTYLATCTVQFWTSLYKRYIKEYAPLPKRLLPDFINVRPGLRARVVRALFWSYPVFKERLLPTSPVYGRAEDLTFQTCYLFWYRQTFSVKRGSKLWTYFFKFQRREDKGQEVKNHLKLNTEQNMCLLQVTCHNFMQLPSITGLVLTTVSISVGRDMRSHQVKMTFHPPKQRNQYRKSDGLLMALDPVIDVKVLRWWHPSYPHPLEAV